MLFNSKIFILLFLPLVLMGYYGCNKYKQYKAGMIWLVAMSFLFYGYFKPIYLPILWGSVLFNYSVSNLLLCDLRNFKYQIQMKDYNADNILFRKLILIIGILVNLLVLTIFKYDGFLKTTLNQVFSLQLKPLGLLMPLGISFFTFQQISYLVDSYRREVKEYDLLTYTAYVFFFPQLVAGPIVLHTELIPQFQNPAKKVLSQEWLAKGIYAFSLGLAKKVLIADTLSLIVNAGFADVNSLDSTNALLTMFAYTFQIYFDFSGYCDMARGIGYMFHIDLPNNFDSPYKSISVTDFWKRWHMTLTRFLTKYVYIPLGGNREGKIKEYCNVLLVFTISGLWHGANWTFILWGIMHGIIMVFERVADSLLIKIPKVFRFMFTFLFLSMSWVYFRADSIKEANALLSKIFSFQFGQVNEQITGTILELEEMVPIQLMGGNYKNSIAGVFCILFILILCLSCLFMRNTQEKVETFKPTVRKYLTTVILLLYSLVSITGASIFLYFNF